MRILSTFVCVMAMALTSGARAQEKPAAEEKPRAQEKPRDIVDVATLADLRAQEPIRAGEWEVRLGLADGGSEAGPWKLLYCWAVAPPGGQPAELPQNAPHERLGPLRFSVGPAGRNFADQLKSVSRQPQQNWREALFAGHVPLSSKGDFEVRVYAPGATDPLAVRRISVKEPAACPWATFAAIVDRPAGRYVVDPNAVAAWPHYEGAAALLIDADIKGVTEPAARENVNRLPGALPMGDEWLPATIGHVPAKDLPAKDLPVKDQPVKGTPPLKLALEDGQFIISLPGGELTDWPDWYLLARWWVNGEAKYPPRGKSVIMQAGRAVKLAEKLEVGVGLPAFLGAKAGDRVELAVMYAPYAYQRVPQEEATLQMHFMALRHGKSSVPLISNRLEIEVTEELLKRPGRDAQ